MQILNKSRLAVSNLMSHRKLDGQVVLVVRLSVVRDNKQLVAKPYTTRPSGQALSGERQQAICVKAFYHQLRKDTSN